MRCIVMCALVSGVTSMLDKEELAKRTEEAEGYVEMLREVDRYELEMMLRQCYVAKFSRKADRERAVSLLKAAEEILLG